MIVMVFLVVTLVKTLVAWDNMGAGGLDYYVRSNGVGYGNSFTDVIWIF